MRIIAHLDMDAFFAAVEERANPRWRGFGIVIGADPQKGQGRGVVSTANYKAREYGIHSAMPISAAWQLAQVAKMQGKPETIFLEPDMARYSLVSQNIVALVRQHVPLIEPAGIDEMYLDLTFTESFRKAAQICRQIKKEIKAKEKLTCSIGLGPNKLVAKIASDFKKPNGLTIVGHDSAIHPVKISFKSEKSDLDEKNQAVIFVDKNQELHKFVEKFLDPLPIRKIPGIGPKTEEIFKKLDVKIIKDLKKFSEAQLHEMLGQWGLNLYEKIRGIDDSPVQEFYEPKSIGEQETFNQDTRRPNFIFERLTKMAENIIKRLGQEGFKDFRTITITVRFADFETKTKSKTLEKPTSHLSILQFEAMKLLTPFLDKRQNPRNKLIRLIGLRVEKLN